MVYLYFEKQIRIEERTGYTRLYLTTLNYPIDLLKNMFLNKVIIITYSRGGVELRGGPITVNTEDQILSNLIKFEVTDVAPNSECTNNDQLLYIDIYDTRN